MRIHWSTPPHRIGKMRHRDMSGHPVHHVGQENVTHGEGFLQFAIECVKLSDL